MTERIGHAARRIMAALSPGPMTTADLTATIYGADDETARGALRDAISRLRKSRASVDCRLRYRWSCGRPHDEASKQLWQLYGLLKAQPMTADEIAQDLYGNKSHRRSVLAAIYRLRRAGVVIDSEFIYLMSEKGNP